MKTQNFSKLSLVALLTVALFMVACGTSEKATDGESAPVAKATPKPTPKPTPVVPSTPPRTDVRVSDIVFGSQVGKYNMPDQLLKQFTAGSQIYVVVITDGNGPEVKISATVKNLSDDVVYEEVQKHVPNGSWATAFNLSKVITLPAGEYLAEARLDGHLVAQKRFRVNG